MKQIVPGLWEIDEIGDFVHCYAWEWEEGVTLIDVGTPGTAQALLDAVTNHGWPLHTVRRGDRHPCRRRSCEGAE